MLARVHVFGASGSGTSTLGVALAERFGYQHLDVDDFYWEPTTPPFRQPRARAVRQARLASALDASPRWILAGSLCGWGDVFIPRFELAVFITVPTPVRLARLAARERRRYGPGVEPGGAMHEESREFLAWAARYDDGGVDMRSRALHEAWLAALPCPTARLDGDAPLDAIVACVARLLGVRL